MLKAHKIDYKTIPGEAAFYGPKIDIKLVDAIGRLWQLSTVQFDFNLPQRFGLEYVAEDGSRKLLEITGVENPQTLLTVSVYLKPANAPGNPGVEVGTFAAVKNGGKVDWPSNQLTFDVTNAIVGDQVDPPGRSVRRETRR